MKLRAGLHRQRPLLAVKRLMGRAAAKGWAAEGPRLASVQAKGTAAFVHHVGVQ